MRPTEQGQDAGGVSLLQLLFVTYYPFGYKPCVEIIMDQRGTFFIRKTKRKLETILKFVPIIFLSLSWFLCGVAILIVVAESKTYFEVVRNPVVGTWGIATLLSLSGTMVYKVWVFDGLDMSVKMANEVLTIEREVGAGLSRERPRGRQYSPRGYSLTRFQFIDWLTIMLYSAPPFMKVSDWDDPH
ncbi:hypothetical protein Fcan01_17061 [Folsomia candida]|uniref:Uncharacterized protein n=1 Tax=Folsomia candida TaxID=158441 RepID=A0A226DSX0_FOLCA|nr:hypothetical protein Fcan01_17061 [Folsomia candida]